MRLAGGGNPPICAGVPPRTPDERTMTASPLSRFARQRRQAVVDMAALVEPGLASGAMKADAAAAAARRIDAMVRACVVETLAGSAGDDATAKAERFDDGGRKPARDLVLGLPPAALGRRTEGALYTGVVRTAPGVVPFLPGPAPTRRLPGRAALHLAAASARAAMPQLEGLLERIEGTDPADELLSFVLAQTMRGWSEDAAIAGLQTCVRLGCTGPNLVFELLMDGNLEALTGWLRLLGHRPEAARAALEDQTLRTFDRLAGAVAARTLRDLFLEVRSHIVRTGDVPPTLRFDAVARILGGEAVNEMLLRA